MRKKELAPGDSTVVELSFDTKSYRTSVNKNATIYTNDLTNSQVKIYVSARVDTASDHSLPIIWAPRNIKFSMDDRKFEVDVTNKSNIDINLAQVGDLFDGLKLNMDKTVIKPGENVKIEFQWKGGFEKEDFARSVTFTASGPGETRFTIPYVVGGTDPTPKPKPAAKKRLPTAKTKQTSQPKKSTQPKAGSVGE